MRAFPARLDDDVYDELKQRAQAHNKSMNAVLNESLDRHFRGVTDAKAVLLQALDALERTERSVK